VRRGRRRERRRRRSGASHRGRPARPPGPDRAAGPSRPPPASYLSLGGGGTDHSSAVARFVRRIRDRAGTEPTGRSARFKSGQVAYGGASS
jgi:hypothetical protein